MAGKNNGLDAIMAMMALKTLMNGTKDLQFIRSLSK